MNMPDKMPNPLVDKDGNSWFTDGYILSAKQEAVKDCNEDAALKVLNNALNLAAHFVDSRFIKEWLESANKQYRIKGSTE